MGEVQSREGLLYLVQVSDSIVVAVLPYGLRDISYIEANRRYSANMSVGHTSPAEAAEREVQAMQDEIDSFMRDLM